MMPGEVQLLQLVSRAQKRPLSCNLAEEPVDTGVVEKLDNPIIPLNCAVLKP